MLIVILVVGWMSIVVDALKYLCLSFFVYYMCFSIFIIVCYFRFSLFHFTTKRHLGLEMAIWYWHFVDVVWILVFICVYWWGNSNPL